ncbi:MULTISPECIES: N-acetylglucosamine kinase [Actinosynnema]|uniref:N-acetylglucosamine kinase n=1 Tax=Actinosynnema TaxID=40566 RepID=UPI0020A5B9A9|nr:BadF/BadG/BcrA/BcrD ATPase family protein [Actinosynnema pretiosum]MCP2096829.1 BadF-type ATPase [Actinosynnema pretiosum]
MSFVVGVDGGGTSTRALLFGADGTRLGAGRAGGSNPNSVGSGTAAANLRLALEGALSGVDAGAVRAGVLGMAGSSKLTDPEVEALFLAAWAGAGLRCPMRVVTDCEAAFAAGTAAPDGTVLVGGTGSIAARVRGRRVVGTVGGHGWLLGDEGSAFWLGREAVRAALRALEAGELDGLARAVLERAGVGEGPGAWARLITAANAGPPVALAGYAPLVTEAAGAPGEVVAARIVGECARVLADLAAAARTADEVAPVVLVGSLVDAPVLGERLRAELAVRTDGEVVVVREAAVGAAWLAALESGAEDGWRDRALG